MNRIKDLRLEKSLTQAKLAKLLGLNQTAIGKYERGELEPNIQTLIKLSRLFECSIDYLIGNTDDFGNVTVENTELSENEQKLLEDYRSLPRQEKVQAEEYVHYLAERRGLNKKKA